jgi:hypothetical protein
MEPLDLHWCWCQHVFREHLHGPDAGVRVITGDDGSGRDELEKSSVIHPFNLTSTVGEENPQFEEPTLFSRGVNLLDLGETGEYPGERAVETQRGIVVTMGNERFSRL